MDHVLSRPGPPPRRVLGRRLRVRRFLQDRRGIAALEFALVAPILFLMFYGIAELGEGLIAERRVSHATEALGDLVAQEPNIDSTAAADMFNAATDIMTPLPSAPLLLRVTSVTGDANGNPKVDWSMGAGLTPYTKNQAPPVILPTGLIAVAGDTIILSQSQYQFASPVGANGYVLPGGLTFNRSAYLRPRAGAVSCTSC